MAAPYYGMIEEVCVLLVDDDTEFVVKMTDLLKSHDYKVMMADTPSTAISMLSKGEQKIDVMILNVHSSNLLSFALLTQAVTLNIISLVVYDELNESVAKKTLDDGAYLYLKKSFDQKIVKYLWQFVLSEKIRRDKTREGLEKNRDQMKVNDIDNNNSVRRKDYTEWTEDLHAKFMQAVHKLGEGRCYPMEILEMMNVPGLTRMQVASHLQKCRRNNWRSPRERKYIRHLSGQGSSRVFHETRSGFRKFGTMPRLQANVLNQQHHSDHIQRSLDFPFPTLDTNNIFARGESSIQQQLCRPQLQVQFHYRSIGNPFNHSILSSQTNISGGLQQQQHRPLFGMLVSQELQAPIIENTNYRPDLALNGGGSDTQNNYNFDLNVAQGATYSCSRIVSGRHIENAIINGYNLNVNMDNVTTYPSSAIMSDTYVGNTTINGLGATNVNANSQQYVGELNMSNPRNIVAASYENYVEGSNSNEKGNFDAFLNFNNMGYLFQNLGPPGANLPNDQDSEFDQVYSNDQVTETSSESNFQE